MMMVAARGEKSGLIPIPLRDGKTKHAMVEADRTVEVGDFEVNVADAGSGMNWASRAHRAVVAAGRREWNFFLMRWWTGVVLKIPRVRALLRLHPPGGTPGSMAGRRPATTPKSKWIRFLSTRS